MTIKELTALIRPLRLTIERSLTWEGAYTAPAPIQVGPFRVTANVVTSRGRNPFSIWYRAERDGRAVIEVSSQPTFVRLLVKELVK